MKKINLTRGYFAIVDDEDYEYLNQWKWFCEKGRYAVRNSHKDEDVGDRNVYMHRQLMGDPYKIKELTVDHINGNGMDNRKSNLRWATIQENLFNKSIRSNNSSGFIGVSYHKYMRKGKNWRARIMIHQKEFTIGYFDSPILAAHAYNIKAKELFGQFARLNDIGA